MIRFIHGKDTCIGIINGNGIINLSAFSQSLGMTWPTTVEAVISDQEVLQKLVDAMENHSITEFATSEEEIEYLPVSSTPEKIICVGVNYQEHADEANQKVPDFPVLFNKYSNSLHAHNAPVEMPSTSAYNDYEAELAVIIGKEARDVDKEKALEHVFGYTIANDLSSRDWQSRTHQWMLGKAIDQYCPIGPEVVTADEITTPHDLDIKLYLNGELRQDSNTSKMIYDCADIISYLSQHLTLKPGDVILTGTPSGVILGMEPDKRQYLQDGDEVVVEIEHLGRLRNKMIRN